MMPILDRRTFLRPIAHRGLHDAASGVVENTAPAFGAAMARGYGIECDLRPAAGGLPLVFHDLALERLTTAAGPVAALTADAASRVAFKGTDVTGILTFAALLALVAGRVPLFAEVKSEWEPPDPAFLAEIARLARGYAGPLAVMSFDPAVVAALKALAPAVPRGLVSGSYFHKDGTGWWPGSPLTDARRQALARLEESAAAAPAFYAYEVGALPAPAIRRARAVERLPVLAWTVRTEDDRRTAAAHADAAIFEGYLP